MTPAHQDADELARRPLAERHVRSSALARLDVALDVVAAALARLVEEIVLGKRDRATRADAHNALARLFLALSGREQRFAALDQAALIMPGKPSPAPEDVRGWIAAWESFGDALFAELPRRTMLEADAPPGCLAGGVTTRAHRACLCSCAHADLACGCRLCPGYVEPVASAVAGEGGA